jgi:hypothetical protein
VRKLLVAATVVASALVTAGVAAAGTSGGTQPPAGFWVAGDLHVHTIYGHDTCITPTQAWDPTSPSRSARRPCADPYTVSFTPRQRLIEAAARGLDYVALSDHNNVLNQSDPAVRSWLAHHPDFVELPAYENSQPGHVQMLGARTCFDNAGPVPTQHVECDELVTDRSAAGEQQLANSLRAAGGVFQINHPSDMSWLTAFPGYPVVPDTVEVWNIGPWVYQHPFPASNDNDFSLRWYDGFLRAGYHVGLTGGSDTHWVATDAVQGVGEPTTWVFVKDRSVQGILNGLRAHRTSVSALPPAAGGVQAFLEADRDGDGVYESVVGSTTAPSAQFRLRVSGAWEGSVVRIVTDAGSVQLPLLGPSMSFHLGQGGVPTGRRFVRVEVLRSDLSNVRRQTCDGLVGSQTTLCHDRLTMQALTSPIFLA